MVLGFIGQFFFSMRFIVQWVASEKHKKSVVPLAFWVFSVLGSFLLLIYAIYRKDPVFILGQAPNLLIYFRNIWLIKTSKKGEL
jgi:lipid A biosynthesis domain-containing protein